MFMKQKSIAIFISIAVLIAAATPVAGCVASETANKTFNADTYILGDWESEGNYTAGDVTFTQVYHFATDKTGTLSAKSNKKIITTVDVYWSYSENEKAYMAFTPSTGNYDYLLPSADEKSLVSEYGEVYNRL